MKTIYFPEAISGWVFFTLLMSLLVVASYTDQRLRVVPKWLTLPALGLGLLVNFLRGCWVAAHDLPVFALGRQGTFLGGIDGLYFSLTGVLMGFCLMFALWLLGVCGGGDVKLFAALGAWIGPGLVISVLVVSLVMLSGYLVVHLAVQTLRGRRPTHGLARSSERPRAGKEPRKQRVIFKYSVVVAASTAVVLLWAFRIDFRLVPPPEQVPVQEARTHAR